MKMTSETINIGVRKGFFKMNALPNQNQKDKTILEMQVLNHDYQVYKDAIDELGLVIYRDNKGVINFETPNS